MSLIGNIDVVETDAVVGWAIDPADPARSATLRVTIDGQASFPVAADLYRDDLERAGFGDGRHGFRIPVPARPGLIQTQVEVQREDGSHVHGSPVRMPLLLRFDDALKQGLTVALADVPSADELLPRAAFLAQAADRLLQLRADARSGGSLAERQFRDRWTGQAPSLPPARRALVIGTAVPEQPGGAAFQLLTAHTGALQRLGYAVTFAAADMTQGPAAAALEAAGVVCCLAPWCGSVEEVLRRERDRFGLVTLHGREAAAYIPLLRLHQPSARVVLGLDTLDHLRLTRQAVLHQQADLAHEARRLRVLELAAARQADVVLVPSADEAAALGHSLPAARVHVVPRAVPFSPTVVPVQQRQGLAYLGDFTEPADVAAAWWVVQELMPRLLARDPSASCLLVGRGMPAALRASAGAGIRPLGEVGSLAEVFDQVRLTVAPAGGSAAQEAVVASLAAGVPCACTAAALDGMGGTAPLQAMRVDQRDGLFELVPRLHVDLAFNAECSEAGLAYVALQMSDARVDRLLAAALAGEGDAGAAAFRAAASD